MNIDKNKFDTSLPCDMEPFAFIEKVTKIKTKKAGTLSIISFGAMDYNNHYSPEFGGVALVHHNPDLFIAQKHIPWNAELRETNHQQAVNFLNENVDIEPDEITEVFYHEFDYFLPYMLERKKRNYLKQVCMDKNDMLNQSKDEYENTELKEALEEIEKSKESSTKNDVSSTPSAIIKETGSQDDYLDGEKLI
jgi:hypothetical protein